MPERPMAAILIVSLMAFTHTVLANVDAEPNRAARPNVVLIMTDDQGYGDLACHGNPAIQTPALDRLYGESVRLTDYHVDPTCSPTRSALLTGRYSSRTGVWHTIMGRSILHREEVTAADVFAASGYRTGIFGKWHLGDNHPHRPQDRGFHEVLIHGGGGVGQTPDYWSNDYFDDTYFHNGRAKKFTGYCTDIWFDGAIRFIEANKDRPFFAYIPTNAAHGPFNVAEKYSKPYKKAGIPSPRAEFYGMITNIDENVARLRKRLDELGLAENTILIFTTDNGTAAGTRGGGFNAGMRGTKGSEYDGGHRVPFFVRWPDGGIGGGRDVDVLSAHIDVLPTLIDLCRLKAPASLDMDGTSLARLLTGDTITRQPRPVGSAGAPDLRNRTLFVHSQRIEHPQKWRKSAVMTRRWRLVNGRRLFDMKADPGQRRDVAEQHPRVVEKLQKAYDGWWEHISERFDGYVRIDLGAAQANPTHLTCHDWHTGNATVPWHQGHIRRDLKANGFWAVNVVRDGTYRITLRSRPAHVGHRLEATAGRVRVGGKEAAATVKENATEVTVRLDLPKGPAKLQTRLTDAEGDSRGAYFVEVERLE